MRQGWGPAHNDTRTWGPTFQVSSTFPTQWTKDDCLRRVHAKTVFLRQTGLRTRATAHKRSTCSPIVPIGILLWNTHTHTHTQKKKKKKKKRKKMLSFFHCVLSAAACRLSKYIGSWLTLRGWSTDYLYLHAIHDKRAGSEGTPIPKGIGNRVYLPQLEWILHTPDSVTNTPCKLPTSSIIQHIKQQHQLSVHTNQTSIRTQS